ncbi:MAG: protein kinase, partial [Bacteroidetes bacterium]|nr:protein kinase [Bacteroidota bacterium]
MINNRYSIIEKIGEGRSKVFSCTDKYFPDEIIAIKILQYTASDAEIESFKKEFEIIKRLTHQSIISVYDKGLILNIDEDCKTKFDISENDKFFTMERVDGVSFDKCLALKNEKTLLDIIHQISLVLFYIHEANYIYFDLKPENVLIFKIEGKFRIKIIDFGLARYFPNLEPNYICGTAEYLAPEMLKKEEVQFNIDLYALGIMLYYLAYNKFPFSNENELEIFRAHVGKKFEFPSCKYSNKLINLIKKLLTKNPTKRFISSLEIIEELNQKITFEEKISLSIPLNFIKRDSPQNKLNAFLKENSWGNIAIIVGEKGSGKTALLENIFQNNNNSIFIKPVKFNSSFNFWQQFFNQLLYNEIIYRSIDDSLLQYISIHINDNSEELQSELRTIISKIASVANFTLIIDDFDKLFAQNAELFLNLFPILLANQIKIVLVQSSLEEIEIANGIEKEIIKIEPFSDEEIVELVKNSCNNFIDKNELRNLLISYSERTPTSISYFISELIVSGIIDFKNGIILTEYDDSKISLLLYAQDEVFKLLKASVTENELEILETISLFENSITVELISKILETSYESILKIISALRTRNILTSNAVNRNPSFSNLGFKQYIYSGIINSQEKHVIVARIIVEFFPGMDDLIKISQFELAKNFDDAKKIINNILVTPQNNNFPKYKIKLLNRKLLYPLSNNEKVDSLLSLCEILFNVGEYNESLKIINELSNYELQRNKNFQKEKLFGKLLIKTGDVNDGINKLLSVVEKLHDQKAKIYLELAG